MTGETCLELLVTPHQDLRARTLAGVSDSLTKTQIKNTTAAFSESTAAGLLMLGTDLTDTTLSPVATAFRDFSNDCLTALCRATVQGRKPVPASIEQLQQIVERMSPMTCGEYLTADLLQQ